ncbi:FkbM family methyltransferase [Pelagibacteraceae bacterium]|nr:FkbM family methyltransferase [Pelagibacteraceae bacterium]
MKEFIQKIINLFGYKIMKINSTDDTDIDGTTKSLIAKSEPVIFDVGANKGQSITRYKKLFQNPIIHSFEPNIDEVNILKQKYINDKNLYLNNVAVGDKKGNLEFNINAISGHSSFKNLIPNTTWIKKRSNLIKIDDKNYTTKKINAEIITLDDYANEKNLTNIDILKIDTQGFEDKVLLGAQNLLKNNRIKLIQLELIFSEIYENPLNIYDVEKTLIPYNYRLFGISNNGSLMSNIAYQSDFIYISNDTYENFKLISPYFNN